jgi:chloramphenicol-sensitive protein RarD
VLWGMSALYWPLLKPLGAVEIVALRVLWSPIVIIGLLFLSRRWQRMKALLHQPRPLALLAVAGTLNVANWCLFVFAATHNHVVDASLGYFITPLVSVGLGVLVFRERLTSLQWAAVGAGVVAVVILTVNHHQTPWIALGLAATFGAYGLIKKHLSVGALEGLMVETAVLFVPALVYEIVGQLTGSAVFGHISPSNTCLGVGSGVVMTVPVLLFSASATRIPLSLVGMLQFIEPVVQFVIGFFILGEAMPAVRWIGFALVWAALTLLAIGSVRARANRLKKPRPVPDRPPETPAARSSSRPP